MKVEAWEDPRRSRQRCVSELSSTLASALIAQRIVSCNRFLRRKARRWTKHHRRSLDPTVEFVWRGFREEGLRSLSVCWETTRVDQDLRSGPGEQARAFGFVSVLVGRRPFRYS